MIQYFQFLNNYTGILISKKGSQNLSNKFQAELSTSAGKKRSVVTGKTVFKLKQ